MSGTAISNLPAAGTVGLTDLVPVVLLGTPNITQRGTVSQFFANLVGYSIPGALSVTTSGTSGTQVVNFSQFAPTLTNPGLINLPGGLTMCFGQSLSSASGELAVNYGHTFSGAPLFVGGTVYDSAAAAPVALSQGTPTTTQGFFYVFNTTSGTLVALNFFWLAIGPT